MTDYGNSHVTAFFDSRADADAAVDRIVAHGVSRDAIRVVDGAERTGTAPDQNEEKGFFEALGDFFMPDEDRLTYAEGLNRGGYLVSVETTTANRDDVLDILDDEGTVDMDEREESWRADGWTGDAAAMGMAGSGMTGSGMAGGVMPGAATGTDLGDDTAAYADRDLTARAHGAEPLAASGSAEMGDRRDAGMVDGTIDVMEERLRVGKREVDHGRVRVRSYVVETPVEEDVSLHGETVRIERKAVDRALGAGEGAFRDMTLEATETAEEAVVSKEARVTEEISLNKTSEDRTETVRDTVRHTEVEVEDERTGKTMDTTVDRDMPLRKDS